MWVGLAEISWMTLGRDDDASSSSHPETLLSTLSQAALQVPVTISLASASPAHPPAVGQRQPGPKPWLSDNRLSEFVVVAAECS